VLTVNPFVLKMFKNISFKLWIKRYSENKEMRRERMLNGDGDISDHDDQVK